MSKLSKPTVKNKTPKRDGQLYGRVQKANETWIRKHYLSKGYKGFSAFIDDTITEWREAEKKTKIKPKAKAKK